jgi:hypothetical protein
MSLAFALLKSSFFPPKLRQLKGKKSRVIFSLGGKLRGEKEKASST